MNILVALPLLPLAAALWFALTGRGDRRAACWVVALAAFFAIAVALLATSQTLELTHLLVRDRTALVLDDAARPALLLFGGLWLAAALLARDLPEGPAPTALLLGLSAVVTLAVGRGGPLVYAAMLASGYGLYAVVASETLGRWHGRWLVTLLVGSDLLIFEVLLHGTAHPEAGTTRGLVLLTGLALALRSAVPPAHAWLPRALAATSAPTGTLLAAVPAGAAFIGGRRLLDDGGGDIAAAALGLALAAALWSAFAAGRASGARATLGYAAAMTAALLLVTTPTIADTTTATWSVVALAACCAAVPSIGLQHGGPLRSAAMALALASHGLAAAQAAVLATLERSPLFGFLAALVAASSTLLLTMALRRTVEDSDERAGRQGKQDDVEAAAIAIALGTLAAAGLVRLWQAGGAGFDSFWPAPAGVTLGLMLLRLHSGPADAGRLQEAVRRLGAGGTRAAAALRELCTGPLPHLRDRMQAGIVGLWRGDVWSARIARLELMLRRWPATAVLMLVVAIAAAALLSA